MADADKVLLGVADVVEELDRIELPVGRAVDDAEDDDVTMEDTVVVSDAEPVAVVELVLKVVGDAVGEAVTLEIDDDNRDKDKVLVVVAVMTDDWEFEYDDALVADADAVAHTALVVNVHGVVKPN